MLKLSVRLVPHTLSFTDPSWVFMFAHLLGERSAKRCSGSRRPWLRGHPNPLLQFPSPASRHWSDLGAAQSLSLRPCGHSPNAAPARPSLCPLQFPGCQSVGSKPKPLRALSCFRSFSGSLWPANQQGSLAWDTRPLHTHLSPAGAALPPTDPEFFRTHGSHTP